MSLKGSLQTVALPEVLHLLSSTGKSGDFHVSDPKAEGHVWFQEGRIVGFDAASAEEVFEAIFELLRIPNGDFTFAAGAECPEGVKHVTTEVSDLDVAMAAAQDRLKEWHQIVAVVPSAAHRLRLRDDVPNKTVRLDPQQWRMVVSIASGQSVGQLVDAMSLREFEGFKAVRTLVDNSLVSVDEPVGSEEPVEPVVDEAPVADEIPVAEEAPVADERVVEYEPVVEEPVVDDVVEPAVAADEYPVEDTNPMDGETAISGSLLRFGVAPEADGVEDHSYEPAHFSGHADDSDDHYAALRAAMVEVGEDLVPYEGEAPQSDPAHVFQFEADVETDGRAALQALLSEVTEGEVTDGEVDGLADRGPWSDHELSAMESHEHWTAGDEHETSNIVPFAPVHHAGEESDAVAEDPADEEAEEAQPAEEPMNRGLLLKFLSSVRN